MKIHLYTMCWNERRMLPFFLRHYEQFCERMIVYDNGSDDGSQAIIKAHRLCELREINTHGELDERALLHVKGQTWKESRENADWVIVCDVDELLYHYNLIAFLDECEETGITMPVPSGWQMVCERLPSAEGQIYDEVHTGVRETGYSKRVIFDPAAIQEINFTPGCHFAHPQGTVREHVDPALKFLHFKFLGLDYVLSRYAELASRQGHFNLANGFGHHYLKSCGDIAADFSYYQQRARLVPIERNLK